MIIKLPAPFVSSLKTWKASNKTKLWNKLNPHIKIDNGYMIHWNGTLLNEGDDYTINKTDLNIDAVPQDTITIVYYDGSSFGWQKFIIHV